MLIVGLTGSIAMGKSATAQMFAAEGIRVHDADAAVHRLYAGEAAPLVEAAFPGTTGPAGVDRARLGAIVLNDAAALKRLEAIVHPLVRRTEVDFVLAAEKAGARLVVLDIPLLFETGGDARCDAVVVTTAAAEVQRARALARPGMTDEKLSAILAKQMPDAEKRRRAHFLVDSSFGFDSARHQVRGIIRALAANHRTRPLTPPADATKS